MLISSSPPKRSTYNQSKEVKFRDIGNNFVDTYFDNKKRINNKNTVNRVKIVD